MKSETFPMRISFPCLSWAILLLASGMLRAQNAPATAFVRALRIDNAPPRVLHFAGAKGMLPLRMSNVQPSPSLEVAYANPLPVFHNPPPANPQTPYVPDALVPLPAGAREILLLGTGDVDRPTYLAIPDPIASGESRDWLLVNATASPIVLRVGQETSPVLIQAGTQSSYRIPELEHTGAAISAAANVEGQAKVFFSTYWPIHPDKRCLVIFAQDGEKIRVRRITDPVQAKQTPLSKSRRAPEGPVD
jgi:hypothetical protein